MATPGVVIVKSFMYRGNPEEWSNGYHFDGDPPGSNADWRSLVDSLVTLEKPIYPATCSVVRALCYEDYSPHHDSVYTYILADFGGNVPGTLSFGSGGTECPGDDAVFVSWKTSRVSTKGKPVWLRKYFHPAILLNTTTDSVYDDQKTKLTDFATGVLGATDDWPGLVGPDGEAPTDVYRVSSYVTTRTLKRRGRRPT